MSASSSVMTGQRPGGGNCTDWTVSSTGAGALVSAALAVCMGKAGGDAGCAGATTAAGSAG